jgi:hypothetical protein
MNFHPIVRPETRTGLLMADRQADDFNKIVQAVNEAHSNVAAALRALDSVTSLTSGTDEIHDFCVTLKQLETELQLKRAKITQDVQYKEPGAIDPQIA